MCGCKRISGMKKSKFNQKNMTGALVDAGLGLVGYLGAKVLKNKVGFFLANPIVGGGACIAVGLVMSTQGGSVAKIGNGMMAAGGHEIIKKVVPSFADSISGIGAPSYPSRFNRSAQQHRVAGGNRSTTMQQVAGGRNFEGQTIKVP